ncbi:MAG: ATP-binding protein [Bacteroidota bacterium]
MPLAFLAFACNQSNNIDPQWEADFDKCRQGAAHLRDSGLSDSANHIIDAFFANTKDPSPAQLYKKYNFKFNTKLHFNGAPDAALAYADSMRQAAEAEPQVKGHADDLLMAYLQTGDALTKLGRNKQAYKFFVKGKLLAARRGDYHLNEEYFQRLGRANYDQYGFKYANRYFRLEYKALEEDLSHRQPFDLFCRKQEALNNIAITYFCAHENDSALNAYRPALDYIIKNAPRFPDNADFISLALANTYGNMAEVYFEQDSMPQAEAAIRKSLRNVDMFRPKSVEDFFTVMVLANFYIKAGRPRTTDSLLNATKKMAYSMSYADGKLRWMHIKRYLLHANHDTIGAYRLVLALDTQTRKRNKEVGLRTARDVNNEIESIEKELELEMLKEETGRMNMLLGITASATLATLIITWLIVRNLRQSRRSEKRLAALNAEIQTHNSNLQVALEELRQSQAEYARLMKVVAHDLRNPIGGIRSAVDLMQMESAERSAEDAEMLDIIKESADNSLTMIADLLTPAAKPEMLFKELALDTVINNCSDVMRFKAAEKNQTLESALQNINITGDREKLWRVFTNLVGNAIKFSPDGGKIHIGMSVSGQNVTVSVTDNGIGIPPDIQAHIFEDGKKAGRTGTSGEESHGLGLSICKEIVTAHKGKIWVQSKVGQGTTFFVELPLRTV